ncbi:unnamed protein product [Schistocephalus solidus]|uniref:SPX domain-containing protein n=1 Tax=Schistocephalus solidus TaxID=70667 RepID=A0A183SHN6_SCHSO|nr:unnamed protein product [Schistocephalus solidus]
MAATHVFSWLDSLEKDFDRTYVDLDVLIGHGITTDTEKEDFRKKLANLNSIFTQVSLKAQSACEKIARAEDEVYGARMAAKYLDKELAGRIQQIQLVCQKMDGPEYERLWNTLESEILLHRHKTVIRACRGRLNLLPGM